MANSPWPSTYWATALWQDAYWQGMAAASDTTAPTIDTATVPSGGTRIVINYLEAGSPPVLPSSSDVTGYSVTVNGVARSFVLGRSTGAAQHTLFLDTPVFEGDVVRLMYSQSTGNVTDSNLTVNELADIASPGTLVTNNSTVSQSGGSTIVRAIQYIIPMGDSIPPEPVYLTAGDEAGKLVYQLRDTATGAAILVPEDATISFILRELGAVSPEINGVGAVEWGAKGIVSFTFDSSNPVPAAGRYQAVFVVDGVTFPTVSHGGPIPVRISEAFA